MPDPALAELGARVLLALGIFAICLLIGRLVRPLVRARLGRRGRPSYTRVFAALFSAVVAVIGFLLAMTAAFPSVEVADVLASLGIVSVAVGFAFKDVLENLLAGVLLLLRDPFQSGDQIAVAGYDGVVEGVTVRETLLRTFDARRVLIPNATVYTNPIEVQTHFPLARSRFSVVISSGNDLARARSAALDAVTAVLGVAAEPPPQVVAVQWTTVGIELECRLWSEPHRTVQTAVVDRAIEAVHDAFAAEGVALPEEELLVRLSADSPEGLRRQKGAVDAVIAAPRDGRDRVDDSG